MNPIKNYIPIACFTSKILPYTTIFFRQTQFPLNILRDYDKTFKERLVYKNIYFDISKVISEGKLQDNYFEKLSLTCLIHKHHQFIVLENNSILFNKKYDIKNNYGLNVVFSNNNDKYNHNYKMNFHNFKNANDLHLYNYYNEKIQNIYNEISFSNKLDK